jgi:hypothetical protein
VSSCRRLALVSSASTRRGEAPCPVDNCYAIALDDPPILCDKRVPVWQPVDFQLHWQSAPVGNCVKGKRTNNSLSGMWVKRLRPLALRRLSS